MRRATTSPASATRTRPRRAHSIAAQGGINAAKNYRNDGDSVYRLFYDTVKGGDFRARESNVYRLAEVSVQIIDQCVAQGVPFAREYGGLLDNRSFGGVQVSRTFYARGQTGQQLLLGAYQALERQIAAGTVEMHTRHEMLELIVLDGRARGVVIRDMVTGDIETYFADAVVLATGGYGNVFFLSTNAKGCNVTATWRALPQGCLLRESLLHPDSPDLHSGKRRLSVEADVDERVATQRRPDLGARRAARTSAIRVRFRSEIATTTWSGSIRRFGNLVPRDIASRAAKNVCDEGRGVGPGGLGVYLDFADAITRLGRQTVEAKYGNLFEMYAQITGEDPYKTPMRIYPAVHYTMGGLWVDYDLESSIPGLYVTGEANFSDHGANRLGASALMQGLADGYFVLPTPSTTTSRSGPFPKVDASHPAVIEAVTAVRGRIDKLLSVNGSRTVDSFHRELGRLMWDYCGMERSEEGLRKALTRIRELKEEFWSDVNVLGTNEELNQALERAGRVADFFELGELMCIDALVRRESCGGHFRVESQTPMARHCVTMRSSRTCQPGNSPARTIGPSCTRSRWSMNTSR